MNYHLSNNYEADEIHRSVTKKKVVGTLIGITYIAFCFYAILSAEEDMSRETAQKFLESYVRSFAIDFAFLQVLKTLFNILLVILAVKLSNISPRVTKIIKKLIHNHILLFIS
jgi:uncharacterized metal-binding protein